MILLNFILLMINPYLEGTTTSPTCQPSRTGRILVLCHCAVFGYMSITISFSFDMLKADDCIFALKTEETHQRPTMLKVEAETAKLRKIRDALAAASTPTPIPVAKPVVPVVAAPSALKKVSPTSSTLQVHKTPLVVFEQHWKAGETPKRFFCAFEKVFDIGF